MRLRTVFVAVLLFFGIANLFGQKEITLEDIWTKYTFYPTYNRGFESMPNSDFYSKWDNGDLNKYSFETGKLVETLFTLKDLMSVSKGKFSISDIDEYTFDSQCRKVLFTVDGKMVYRRSALSYYYVYDLQSKKLTAVSDTAKGRLAFADFSEDGSKVVFVRDYNLFYVDLESGNEVQITFDGKENEIRNGWADWVYEEELSQSKYYAWSPDGTKIAYYRFDESKVKEFSMTIWGDLYPQEYKYKYPKAGEDNSLVDIYVYDLKSGKNERVNFDREDCYYPRMYWLSNSQDLIVLKLNRLQNKLDFYRYNTRTKAMDIVLQDENACWIDITDNYYFLDDNKTVIFLSERDGYRHIYSAEFGKEPVQLTKGRYEVAEISAVDYQKKTIYYLANETAVPNQDLYSIGFDGTKKRMLTDGTGWNEPTFNSNAHYYCNQYSNANTPPVYTLHNAMGKKLYTIEDNQDFRKVIQEYGFAKKEFFTITTQEGVELSAWMIKPASFNKNDKKKYPVLMYVYGGPETPQVLNSYSSPFDFAWYQMLAQKGYIVVCVDGRGTGRKGDAFTKVIYKQMGKCEAEDQIAAAKYLQTLPYVDASRIGIWGWSFGGYLSALSLFKGDGIFKMAISVAPVTNWRYYDNIYTERFLTKPQDNPSGYDDNSPCFFANKMKGNFLLIHGTADDNVHFQNSMDLVTRLNQAGKQYEQFFYPNKNHSIYGGNTRYHLYVKMTNFILNNL